MPNATLQDNIIDSLVTLIDEIRGDIHDIVGDRQYRVFTVTSVWPSGRRGDDSGGPPTETTTEILPKPKLSFSNNQGALNYELKPSGKTDNGNLTLSEISFTYTEEELSPKNLPADTDFYYKLIDNLGQEITTRYFVPTMPPRPDREKEIGWNIELKHRHI